MNPTNDNTELEEQNIVAARSIMDEPILGSELKELAAALPVITFEKLVVINEDA